MFTRFHQSLFTVLVFVETILNHLKSQRWFAWFVILCLVALVVVPTLGFSSSPHPQG